MLEKGMNKKQIEDELRGKGDFVQINYLNRFLGKDLSIDMRRFVYLKLGEIYDKLGMQGDRAKMFSHIAELSITFSDKIDNHLKEAEAYIKEGLFDNAERAVKKAMMHANSGQKAEINFLVKDFYKRQAEVYEKEGKRNHAVKIYEKLIPMVYSEVDKEEIKEKLMELYKGLGMMKEYYLLKGGE